MALTREPTPDHTAAWIEHVRALGGWAAGMCRGRDVAFSRPGRRPLYAHTACCGNESLVAVPYEGPGGDTRHAKVCAVCDAGTEMPRLAVVE